MRDNYPNMNPNAVPPIKDGFQDPYGYMDASNPAGANVANPSAAGFNRHGSAAAPRGIQPQKTARNPFGTIADKVGGFFANAGGNRSGRAGSEAPTRRGDEYWGVGNACRVCGFNVGEASVRCPSCGAFPTPMHTNPFFWVSIIVGIVLVALLTLAITSCNAATGIGPRGTDFPAGVATEEDKAELVDLMGKAQSIISSQTANTVENRPYTVATYDAFMEAYDAAVEATETKVATIASINQATQALSGGIMGLKQLPYYDGYTGMEFADMQDQADRLSEEHTCILLGQCQIQSISNEGSYFTAVVFCGGNPSQAMIIKYDSASMLNGTPTVGNSVDIRGSLCGTTDDGSGNNVPYFVVDYIYIL